MISEKEKEKHPVEADEVQSSFPVHNSNRYHGYLLPFGAETKK